MLALSSSLAKRCTACIGSSQVLGSMYVLLVGILTAGKAKRAGERGLAEIPPTHPGKHYPSLSISWFVGRINVISFYKQIKRLSSKVFKKFFLRLDESNCSAPLPQGKGEQPLCSSEAPTLQSQVQWSRQALLLLRCFGEQKNMRALHGHVPGIK